MKNKVGKCGFCNKWVYSDQKYEELEHTMPPLGEKTYAKAPIHTSCRLPMYRQFTKELKREVVSLVWLIECLTKKTHKPKKEDDDSG